MKHWLITLTLSCLLLAGCGDTQQSRNDSWKSAGIYYSYPLNGQQDVSPSSPIVLGFLGKVEASPDGSDFELTATKMDGSALNTVPDIRVTEVNNGTGLSLSFVSSSNEPVKLTTGATYTLNVADGSPLAAVKDVLPTGGLTFTVRPDRQGPVEKTWSANEFKVASVTPSDTSTEPMLDFSSIRMTFTHPLDPQTAVYGESITLEQNGKLVNATLLVSGRHITIDPVNAPGDINYNADLIPDEPVTVTIGTDVKDTSGNALSEPFAKTLVPQDTRPRSMMVQVAEGTDCSGVDPQTLLSPLSGNPINCVPVNARLLGDTTVSSQASDGVYAQLAQLAKFPDTAPLRLPKGSLLKGGALKVLIGGHIDAGYDSGEVTVSFISDANGYMLANPYTDNPNAYKLLSIEMDVAFDTKDPRANGAFTQNLLHVKLVGRAQIDPEAGVLKADAIAVVEPEVLGLETGYGVLSFHMESYPDQRDLPVPGMPQPDDRPLSLSSWVPGTSDVTTVHSDGRVKQTDELSPVAVGDANNVADVLRPDSPIILTFNKPLDSDVIIAGDNLTLTHNGTPVDFTWKLSGSSLKIYPAEPLRYSTQTVSDGEVDATQWSTYQVVYDTSLIDLAGEPADGNTLTFSMPVYADVDSANQSAAAGGLMAGHSPVITAMYPGFPCVTTGLNLAQRVAGRCVSAPADGNTPSGGDAMPLSLMPANRAIHVSFSQVMKADTLRLGAAGTVMVERCESPASCNAPTPVDGQLAIKAKGFVFSPQEKWSVGSLYRYTLKSDDLDSLGNQVCSDTGTAICAIDERAGQTGHPLKTALLDHAYGYNQGGPDLVTYFIAAPVTDEVLQQLDQAPVADVDASFKIDPGEPRPYSGVSGSYQLTDARAELNAAKVVAKSPSGDGLVVNFANVGCGWETNVLGIPQEDRPLDCPNDKYTHITGSLVADISGYHTPDDIRALIADGAFERDVIPDALCGGSACGSESDISQGAILTWIYPTQLVASGLTTYARAVDLSTTEAVTGTQVMRIRYTCDASVAGDCDNAASGRVPGWIIPGDNEGETPQFVIKLNIYMDAPNLEKALGLLDNDMHDKPLTLNLLGPLTFLSDGRLQIYQENTNAVDITLVIGGTGKVHLQIPPAGNKLNYVGQPIE